MQPTQTELCPLCGNANQCNLAEGAEGADAAVPCWCFDVAVSKEALARVPVEKIDKTCLCPRCAAGIAADA